VSEALDERILACVESIPPGRVMTYGDIAEYVGTRSARGVGRVLARCGGAVPWHRVVRADGSVPKGRRQLDRLRREGVPLRGDKVDLAHARIPD
jgi:alkylated DNA nucleotide flippase Atl1